jgi:hypothetical protein
VEDAVGLVTQAIADQHGDVEPCFWWPHDHRWMVASDGAIEWTIIGGDDDLIAELVHDPVLEGLRIAVDDELESLPAWVTSLIKRAVKDLIDHAQTIIQTTHGPLEFRIKTEAQSMRLYHSLGGWSLLSPERTDSPLAEQISNHVESLLTDLNYIS